MHEHIHDTVIERSVREMRPSNERVMGNISGGWVSQPPLVVLNELRCICETVLGGGEPPLPTSAVLVQVVDFGRADAKGL